MTTVLTALDGAAGAAVDADRGVVWIVEATTPQLSSYDLTTQTLERHSALPPSPVGVTLSGDRQSLLVTTVDGLVLEIPADRPDDRPSELASVAGPLGQVTATVPASGRGQALLVSGAQDDVLAVRLSDGQDRRVTGLDGITGIVADSRSTWATATVAGDGRLVLVAPTGPQTLATGLIATGHLTLAGDGSSLILTHPGAARATVYLLADGSRTVYATDDPDLPGSLVEVHLLDDGRVVLLTDETLAVAQTLGELTARPRLVPPAAPLFVGSWVPLQYDLSGTGLGEDEVSFVVDDDPSVALISHTALAGTGALKVPMLIAGINLGTFTVSMVETASGTVLDTAPFEVTDHWADPDNGPSRMFLGYNAARPAGDYGGGPSTPQNLGTREHHGRWRVAALLVNTGDGAYPTVSGGVAAARTAVLGELSTGVSFNGQTRSARRYYEELSGWNPITSRGLTLQVHGDQVYGPVDLPGSWGTYFAQGTDSAGVVTDARWSSREATAQTIVSRALDQGVLTAGDLNAIDVLLFVPFSPDAAGTGSQRFVWPHTREHTTMLVGPMPGDSATFGHIFAPPDFATQDGRQLHTTLSHELGHTLGLPDLYDFPQYQPDVTNRLTYDWDMMCGSRDRLPHFSLSNRMRQGWVDAGHLKLFDFSGVGSLDQQVTLHAAELGAPPSGRVRGIEIRLADGWNTYVEYRATQSTQTSDALPFDRRVVLTDVTSDSFASGLARPPIVFVHNDADGDGPLLDTARDYQDVDPGNQKRLVVSVTSTAADSAVVRVKYDAGGRADPGIRTWSGPPLWQSPDIEVRNDRSAADPAHWANTPWVGQTNTVVAKIRNGGDKLAKGVAVDFFVTEFSAGDGPLQLLGHDVHDVPQGAGATEFSTTWTPPTEGHFCIVVRIAFYVDPDLAGAYETSIYNNEARSNYTRFVSGSASPSTRVGAEVLLANPYDTSTIVSADVTQTHGYHRVYVDHQWLRIAGGSSRPIQVFDEALSGFPEVREISREGLDKELSVDNHVSVAGWARPPFERDCGTPTRTGGATIAVGAGHAVEVEIDEARFTFCSGRVRFVDGSGSPSGGTVLLVLNETDGDGEVDPFGARTTATATVDNGRFAVELRALQADQGQVIAHYLGGYAAAPADSEPRRLNR